MHLKMSETPSTNTNTPSTPSIHHSRGRRLRSFALPDGREVHIALSPEEAETLRQKLTIIRKDEPFDLVINGSPEHLEALRRAHSHHESRREALRQKYGSDYDEFENVRTELETLGSELHLLTDHAVALDANFSKYGYSAHLRTYDDAGRSLSRASSMTDLHSPNEEVKNWEEEKRNGRVMKIYKKPTVRQYFHKGLLWRASGTTEVASFELFVDLLYVGILAINGDHAAETPTGTELLRFAITFVMSWKIWADLALIISWFETDDIFQRLSVLFIMACLVGLTTNMLNAMENTYSMLVSFYLTARLFMGTYYIFLSYVVPMVRGTMIAHAVVTLIPATIWIGSIYVDYPNQLALTFIAIFLDIWGGIIIIGFLRKTKDISNRAGEWVAKVFEFYPAVNIEHKVERTNAFVTLVFGYSVVAVLYQSSASFGLNAFYGKAILGLIQAFCFNWIYFELDGSDIYAHAIRRKVVTAIIWAGLHVPFIMSFVLGAAALSKLVLATDCSNTDAEKLTEVYKLKSEPEIAIGLRWFYCAGFGVALACMGIISICHIHKSHKNNEGGVRINKAYRLMNRFAVCIILICLPLAHDLNSLQLSGTVTGLLVWVLLLELWGMSCPNESFFGEKQPCRYTARMRVPRKDLESAVKGGTKINVEEFRGRGEKGFYEMS